MAKFDTDALIDRLAGEAEPVRRLPPVWKRVALWLCLAVPPAVGIVLYHGLVVDLATVAGDRQLLIEQVAALLTAVTAATAAFLSTVPGRGRRWWWLPVIPLGVWIFALGKGCLDDWLQFGPEGLALRPDFECFGPMVLMALIPGAAMLAMLRQGAPLAPRATLFLGALATAAVVAFGLRFFHVGDASIMILTWHMGLAAVLTVAAGVAGPRLLGWRVPAPV
jgi:hypothetical protein